MNKLSKAQIQHRKPLIEKLERHLKFRNHIKINSTLAEEELSEELRKIRLKLYFFGDIELIRYAIFDLQRTKEDVENMINELSILDGTYKTNRSFNNFSESQKRKYLTD